MKSLPPILATTAIVLLLLGGYVGAYLWSGELEYQERIYSYQAAIIIFPPAALVESKFRGYDVRVVYRDQDGDFSVEW